MRRDGVELGADVPLGKRTTVGASSTGTGLAQLLAQAGGVARRREPDAGDDLQDREVPHAVVARAVRAGDAGAVEHEGDAGRCRATSISTWSKARLMKVA